MISFFFVSATALAEPVQYHASQAYGSYYQDETNHYDENYHPNYLLDDNPNTTWTIKADQHKKSIQIPLTPLSSANSITLKVRNGDQKSKLSFTANGAVKTAKINFLDRQKQTKKSVELQFQQEYGWQEQYIELPKNTPFHYIELEVSSGYQGTDTNLISISDIQFFIDSDVPHNKSAQKRNKKRLLKWTEARSNQSKISKQNGLINPFASNRFQRQSTETIPLVEAQQQTQPFRQKMKRLKAQKLWYTRDFIASLPARPFGLYFTQYALPALNPKQLQLVKTTGKTSPMSKQEEQIFNSYGGYHDVSLSNYKVEKDKNGHIKALYFTVKTEVSHMRGHYTTDEEILISYNKEQQLEGIYVAKKSDNGPYWNEETLMLFSPQNTKRKFDVVESIYMDSFKSGSQNNREFDTIEKTTYAISSNN